jgi:hypothetical protein
MCPSRPFNCRVLLLLAAAVTLAGCGATLRRTEAPSGTAVPAAALWVEPADIETRNLFEGPGDAGSAPKPDVTYTFVSEKQDGFSPGFHVKDPEGNEWSVKQGPEAQSEVVLSRVLWAIGYHQIPQYYLRAWTLSGGPKPGVQGPARFREKTKEEKSDGPWSWTANPFVGTQPFRGLVATLLLFNQWDFKPSNNSIYKVRAQADGLNQWYVVRDLGASLGRTPSLLIFHGTRNDLSAFRKERFVTGTGKGDVRFEMTIHGPEHALLHEPTADVQWACGWLSRLSPQQWADAFRAAGYDSSAADGFIQKIHEKIAEGLALPSLSGK